MTKKQKKRFSEWVGGNLRKYLMTQITYIELHSVLYILPNNSAIQFTHYFGTKFIQIGCKIRKLCFFYYLIFFRLPKKYHPTFFFLNSLKPYFLSDLDRHCTKIMCKSYIFRKQIQK